MKNFDPNHEETPVWAKVGQKVVIFNDKNEILFLRRSQNCTRPGGWDFPGGGLDFGEDPIQGIVRETEEETQLIINDIHLTQVESLVNDHGEFIIMIGYKARTSDPIPKLSWEHDEFKWLSTEDALKVDLPELHSKFLKAALQTNSQVMPQADHKTDQW